MSTVTDRFEILDFAVRKSIRYHDHQERTYDALHTGGRFITLLLSLGAVGKIISKHPEAGAWLALVVAVVSAAEMAFGFTKKARLHNDLKRRFCSLEEDLCQYRHAPPSEASVIALECKRLKIEADEPPTKRVLNVMCHNEVCIADERLDHVRPIRLWRRLLGPYVQFQGWQVPRQQTTAH